MPRESNLPEVMRELDLLLTETELAEQDGWMKKGKCHRRGPAAWYPDMDENGNVLDKTLMNLGIGYCQACPVRIPCLTHAVFEIEPEGIWGERLPRYRRRLRHVARIMRPELIYPDCGTVDKYYQHKRKFENPCKECIAAFAEYQHQQRNKPNKRVADDVAEPAASPQPEEPMSEQQVQLREVQPVMPLLPPDRHATG